MKTRRKYVQMKRGWMTAICVTDPSQRRLAANDNVSDAMRAVSWDRWRRVARRFGWGLASLSMPGIAVLVNGQHCIPSETWPVIFAAGALVAFLGAVEE